MSTRCIATKKDGKQCKNRALSAGQRCHQRGGDGQYCGIHIKSPKAVQSTVPTPVADVSDRIRECAAPETPSLPRESIGKMSKWITFNGLNFDIAKSGLQKAIRRGSSSAIAYAIEMDLCSRAEGSSKFAKANRTNLMNRLRICLSEDMFNWSLMIAVEPWFSAWERERSKPSSRKYLLSIVSALVLSKKIRLISDLKTYFYDKNSPAQDAADGTDSGAADGASENHAKDVAHRRAERMLDLLRHRDPKCLYWFSLIRETGAFHIDDVAACANDIPDLKRAIEATQIIRGQLTTGHREAYLFDVMSIAFILFWHIVGNDAPEAPRLVSDEEADAAYRHHIESDWIGQGKMPYPRSGWLPPGIVIDMHTAKGRACGKNSLDFALIGSHVENEDMRLLFPELREAYNAKKREAITGVPSVSNIPSWLLSEDGQPLFGQRVTASWKQFTYITKDYVYKGPFMGSRASIPQCTVERFALLRKFGDEAALEQHVVGSAGEYYLRSPNVGTRWPPKTTTDNVKGSLVGRIVDRESMGIFRGERLIELETIDWVRVLYHFIARYVFWFGDTGLYNVINNWGIDYEENRTGDDMFVPVTFIEAISNRKLTAEVIASIMRAVTENKNVLIEKLDRGKSCVSALRDWRLGESTRCGYIRNILVLL